MSACDCERCVMDDMVAHLMGAFVAGDMRQAAEILALAGRWPAREIMAHLDEAEEKAERNLRASSLALNGRPCASRAS